MKFKNTFFKTLRSAIFLIAMFLFAVSQDVYASDPGDLDIGFCDDLKIRWEKKMAAFYIDITIYDESGDDDWLENIDIYCNGKSFIKINSWWGARLMLVHSRCIIETILVNCICHIMAGILYQVQKFSILLEKQMDHVR